MSLTLHLDGPAAVIHGAVGREEGREGGVGKGELEPSVGFTLHLDGLLL